MSLSKGSILYAAFPRSLRQLMADLRTVAFRTGIQGFWDLTRG